MRAEINLYNEDCLQALKRYADDSFDVAIVDPPYGIGISSNPFRQKFVKVLLVGYCIIPFVWSLALYAMLVARTVE